MKKLIFILLSTLLLFSKENSFQNVQNFLIKQICSNIDYPTKGDEHVSVTYKDYIYFIDILHPNLTNDMYHFSTPIFRVSPKKNKNMFVKNGIETLKTDYSPLTWNSACGYFFVQKNGKLKGYFLENGFDNSDSGSKGIIFTYNGKETNSYYWIVHGHSYGNKNTFILTDTKENKNQKLMLKILNPVLLYAEKKADGWPGP